MQAAVVVILPFLLAGCFFNLREKEDFKSWYYGGPGLAGALGEADCDRYADNIEGQRHPYFLHFRTPEILLQPQGGAHYPARQTAESRAGGFKSNQARCEKVAKGWETFRFDAVDAGWVDTLIPYRKSSAVNDRDRGMGEQSLAYAEGLLYNTGLTAVMKAPVYIVHDILKTLYIPVAGTYYLFKPDEPPQPATEIIQVKGDAPTEGAPTDTGGSGAMVATKTAPDESPAPVASETSPAADDVDAPRAPAAEDRTATLAQAEPGDETPEAPSEEKAGQTSSVDRGEAGGQPDGPTAAPRADAAAQAVGTAGADADRAVDSPPSAESDAAPERIADATAEESVLETDADESRAQAPDGQTPGESTLESRSDEMPAVAEEGAAPETPVTAGEEPAVPPVVDDARAVDAEPHTDPGSAQPPSGPGVRAAEQDAPPAPVESAAGEAVRDDAAALSAQSASDARPPGDAKREADAPEDVSPDASAVPSEDPAVSGTREAEAMPGEQPPPTEPDQAPLTAEPPAVDADRPAETARGVGETPDKTAGQALSAASGDGDSAAEADTPTAPAEDASSPAEPPVESQAEEDRVGAAVTSLTAVAKGAAGATDSGEPMPSASSTQGGEIQEEDLLSGSPEEDATAASGDGGDAAEAEPGGATEDADAPPMTDIKPLREAGASPDPVASVTSDQRAVPPQEPSPLAPIDRVRVAQKALQKKVAFIGFFSRAVNIEAETKAALQAYFWPALESECKDNLTLLRRGDAGYPDALNSLVRDPFGRMNSFELVTLARFSGLNAVVAGTIIDIRTANALSGILWYKSPQGQLRVTILVEVFDAETGTKLFDRNYIREEEVNELEPGADGRLRSEDLPVLEAALQSVALEMGDDVCDALEDQPWRAFVSGIDGKRVTLSAGQEAGLKPGNILGVYNSQIIDGLNNQQFFLTGEKVGRIQLIHVYPDRSEAVLIEGRGVRDYSVVMPD